MSGKYFGVKTVYVIRLVGDPRAPIPTGPVDTNLVEERVVLIRAANADEAIAKAEAQAADYEKTFDYDNPYGQKVICEYIGACDAYEMIDESIEHGTEVFSSTRLVDKNASHDDLADLFFGKVEDADRTNRLPFLNAEFNAPD